MSSNIPQEFAEEVSNANLSSVANATSTTAAAPPPASSVDELAAKAKKNAMPILGVVVGLLALGLLIWLIVWLVGQGKTPAPEDDEVKVDHSQAQKKCQTDGGVKYVVGGTGVTGDCSVPFERKVIFNVSSYCNGQGVLTQDLSTKTVFVASEESGDSNQSWTFDGTLLVNVGSGLAVAFDYDSKVLSLLSPNSGDNRQRWIYNGEYFFHEAEYVSTKELFVYLTVRTTQQGVCYLTATTESTTTPPLYVRLF